jgi:hypothetical protein
LRVVILRGVEGEDPQGFALGREDSDLGIGDHEHDRLALETGSHPDMADLALLAKRQPPTGVDFVVADAQMAGALCKGMGFDPGIEDRSWDPSSYATVRTALVVIGDEDVDLTLQLRQ